MPHSLPGRAPSTRARDAPGRRTDTPWRVFARFLRFGLLAWGGPAPQIAMIKQECVDELGWVDEETFKKTLAVYQVLPGPEAHELCVYFGRVRAGRLGGFAAGLGFMLPGFLLMLGLSVLYVELDLAGEVDELFYGMQAAVVALVARATVRLGGTFLTDLPLALIAAAAFLLAVFADAGFLLILAGAGLAYELVRGGGGWARGRGSAFAPLPALAIAVGTATGLTLTAELLLEGLKAGLLTFGGAYTVIPFLEQSAVEVNGWLSESEFVDGLALGGILPAPLIIFSTFVGYLAGGLAGGVAMTFGIFLPAFLFPIFLHRQLVAIADNPRIRPFLLGVAAGVIGLIAAVGIEIAEIGVPDLPAALLALAAFAALTRFHTKLTVVWVVFGCGALGLAAQLTVL